MKKIINLATALLLAVLFVPSHLGAFTLVEDGLDQYSVGGAGGNNLFIHAYSGQSFKPTNNILNKVSINLRGNGELVGIQLTKTGQNGLLIPGAAFFNTTVDANYKWYDVSFANVAVTPGDNYTLWVASSGPGAFWNMNPDGGYSRGKAYMDCATLISNDSCDHWLPNADWDFKVYGFTPATPVPPSTPVTPSASNPIGGTSLGTTSNKATATVATLQAPVLVTVLKNSKSVEVPVKEEINITQNGKLSLAGTSTAGAEVTVTLNEKSYPATMEANGNWKLDLLFKEITEGEYSVKAKTVKDGKNSTEVELFKVQVQKAEKGEGSALVKGWYGNWNIFYTLIAVGVLLIVLLGLALMARRHHHENKAVGPKKEDKPKS